jgi:uncharacterized tellurite resistance protein B-like protein
MDISECGTALAAQQAFIDLLELAELAAQGDGPAGSEALRADAQTTILMLIAAVMLADGEYDPGEQEFLRLLVDLRDKPGGEVSFLNEYAARWAETAMEIPRFYRAAVRRDAGEGTGIGWKMRCRIQLIGNYASISDGKFAASEFETVRRYVAFLEEFANACGVHAQAEGGESAPCGSEGRPRFETGPAAIDAVGQRPEGPKRMASGPEIRLGTQQP